MNRDTFIGTILILVLAGLFAVISGCGDDDPGPPPPTPEYQGQPFPGTADQLMANFQFVYESRDYLGYRRILSPLMATHLHSSTIDEYPDVGETLDFDEELRIHERMYSGLGVIDPHGNLVPGVQKFNFMVFRQMQAWAESGPDDVIPGVEWAPFAVNILFDRGESYSTIRTEGTINFYVTSRDSLHQGANRKYYQMLGQVDWTGSGKTEQTSWGSIKAMFR